MRALAGLLLIAVLALGWAVWRAALHADRIYRELAGVRLDPLGLAAFPGGAVSAGVGGKEVVVFLGDSRAAEWQPPALGPDRVAVNRGIGGQTTAQVLGRFARHVAPLRPRWVVLSAGINDLKAVGVFPDRRGEIVAACGSNLEAAAAAAREIGAAVVVTTVIPAGDPPWERLPYWPREVELAVEEVNVRIRGMAGRGVAVLDAARLLADGRGRLRRECRRDFLHLNAEGYRLLNEALIPLLRDGGPVR